LSSDALEVTLFVAICCVANRHGWNESAEEGQGNPKVMKISHNKVILGENEYFMKKSCLLIIESEREASLRFVQSFLITMLCP